MGIERRTFLQKVTLGLLALGASEAGLMSLGNQRLPWFDSYFKALADTSSRKLALLVGINSYPNTTNLQGCLTDVELQRELLLHRFGFNQQDILTLTDTQATRENIETAFVQHLSKQAKSTDVVLFHFSGYGHRTQVSTPGNSSPQLVDSLVPVDGITSRKANSVTHNLPEDTLLLLGQSLATTRATMILDTSYVSTGQTLEGNLRTRSYPVSSPGVVSTEELAFQEGISANLRSSNNKDFKGIMLRGAGNSEPALEAPWRDFTAGLFTYALTQYLWQAIPAKTIHISLKRSCQAVAQIKGKSPQSKLVSSHNSGEEIPLTYYLHPQMPTGADGFLTTVAEDGKTSQVYLGGLPATVLPYYSPNSLLRVLPPPQGLNTANLIPNPIAKLQIREFAGLNATAQLWEKSASNGKLEPGQLIQELVRVLPRNLALTVAVGPTFSRIERVDATSAFANISSVSSIVVAGEGNADYLLSRNGSGGYGLFSPGNQAIPETIGSSTEAIKSAVNRLTPNLTTLLAKKILRLTVNEGSSLLGLRVNLEQVRPEEKVLLMRETFRNVGSLPPQSPETLSASISDELPKISLGSRVQYRFTNYSDRPLYFMLVGFDSGSHPIAIYCPDATETQPTDTLISPQETLVIPQTPDSFSWNILGPKGLAEIYALASVAPFSQTLKVMSAQGIPKGKGERVINLVNPLEIVKAIMGDLHVASAVPSDIASGDVYAFDVNAWASLSFMYQVV